MTAREQSERIERKARDLAEAFLDGRVGLEIKPLTEGTTILGGFSITVQPRQEVCGTVEELTLTPEQIAAAIGAGR